MSKLTVWKCDICKKRFEKGTSGSEANVGFEIIIPSGSQLETSTRYSFDDTCVDCRANMVIAIENLINVEE